MEALIFIFSAVFFVLFVIYLVNDLIKKEFKNKKKWTFLLLSLLLYIGLTVYINR